MRKIAKIQIENAELAIEQQKRFFKFISYFLPNLFNQFRINST
jgi:hypothetical protein